MTYPFNLLNEKWIPCIRPGGPSDSVSLQDAILGARDILEIFHPSPLVTISLHRLILAVVHRCCGPTNGPGGPVDADEWQGLWAKKAWDCTRLERYFAKYESRFCLFESTHPFYQTPEPSFEPYETTAGLLSLSPPYRSHPTLFDHGLVELRPSLSPPEAAFLLVAQQAFACVNLVTYEHKKHKSAKAAPLVRSAVVLNCGSNLFETLMLNLHPYNPDNEEPFPFDPEKDMPAWERTSYTAPRDRSPDGYLDWLTWQSRRIRLRPSVNGDDHIAVSSIVIMKGFQLPKRKWRRDYETMVPFRTNKAAKADQDPWPSVQFEEERSLWRDSLSLVQSVPGACERPRMADWIADLKIRAVLPHELRIRLAVFGLSASQAKPEFWRREELPLDVRFYSDEELFAALSSALSLADRAGDTIKAKVRVAVRRKGGAHQHRRLWRLGYILTLPDEPAEISEEQERRIRELEDHVSPERAYWPQLETPFKQLLVDLPEDVSADENGATVYGAACLRQWAATLRHAAREAFAVACAAVGESARALKARAKAESLFEKKLNGILRPFGEHQQEGGEEA